MIYDFINVWHLTQLWEINVNIMLYKDSFITNSEISVKGLSKLFQMKRVFEKEATKMFIKWNFIMNVF